MGLEDHLMRATGTWRGGDKTSTSLPVVRQESYQDQTRTTEFAQQPLNVGVLCTHESLVLTKNTMKSSGFAVPRETRPSANQTSTSCLHTNTMKSSGFTVPSEALREPTRVDMIADVPVPIATT